MKERQSITGVGKESQANIERSLRKERIQFYTDHRHDPAIGEYFTIYPHGSNEVNNDSTR